MKNTTVKKAPVKKVTAKKVPSKKAPVKKVAAKKTPVKKVAAKKTLVKKAPVKKAPVQKTETLDISGSIKVGTGTPVLPLRRDILNLISPKGIKMSTLVNKIVSTLDVTEKRAVLHINGMSDKGFINRV